MAWDNKENVVKKDGKCWNRGKHKHCSYWNAKLTRNQKKEVIGFRCSLCKEDKEGYASLPICNKTYGQTFDGDKNGNTTV